MAEITTLPFRSICKQMGADIVFTPMISSDAVIHNLTHTLKLAQFKNFEQPIIIQIFGYDGKKILKAIQILDKNYIQLVLISIWVVLLAKLLIIIVVPLLLEILIKP